jgi:hypothetical protein
MTASAEGEDFVAAVAGHFIKRRGRGTMLSPADLACLAEWERAGVGAATAIRGIDEAFRRGGEIRSLSQCRWAVEEEERRGRAAAAGRDGPRQEEQSLDVKLAALAAALDYAAGRAGEARAEAAIRRAAAAAREAAQTVDAKDAPAAQRALDGIERGLLIELEATLAPAEGAALERDAREELRGRNLKADVARRTARAVVERKLRERFRLPPFSI